MGNAIEVEGLHKSYGTTEAVRGLDLDVKEGEIFAFLGPNGAGKTTTIEILEGFRIATSGIIRVLGEDPAAPSTAWREDIGIVLQDSQVETELTVRETVTMFAAYYQAPRRVDEVIEIAGLTEKADERIGRLSGGQKRRVDLALALIGDPKLIFLDEPTTGFDPSARRDSWEMIDNLRQLGRTIMLTTHYMDEAQYLADRIAVIADGRIVASGTAQDLADQVETGPTISFEADRAIDVSSSGIGLDINTVEDRSVLRVAEDDLVGVLHQLTSIAKERDVALRGLEVTRPTLEDTYLRLIAASEEAG